MRNKELIQPGGTNTRLALVLVILCGIISKVQGYGTDNTRSENLRAPFSHSFYLLKELKEIQC